MRIVYVNESATEQGYGSGPTAARVIKHLQSAGHELQLIGPGLKSNWIGIGALRRLWQCERPALVHAANAGPMAFAALHAARTEGIPSSADCRLQGLSDGPRCRRDILPRLHWHYARWFHRLADCNFVPTASLASRLADFRFRGLHVMGHGVDTECFSPARRCRALRMSWAAADADPVLLYVGHLSAHSDVLLALVSYEQLRQLWPTIRMVVVGEGSLRSGLQALYPSVLFVGMPTGEALARHYASADVLLQPDRSDDGADVMWEALASGLSVVAYAQGAAAQELRDGVNGWLAELGDAGGFLGAACRAVAALHRNSAVRALARMTALKADCLPVLNNVERQLRRLADREADMPHEPSPALA